MYCTCLAFYRDVDLCMSKRTLRNALIEPDLLLDCILCFKQDYVDFLIQCNYGIYVLIQNFFI